MSATTQTKIRPRRDVALSFLPLLKSFSITLGSPVSNRQAIPIYENLGRNLPGSRQIHDTRSFASTKSCVLAHLRHCIAPFDPEFSGVDDRMVCIGSSKLV